MKSLTRLLVILTLSIGFISCEKDIVTPGGDRIFPLDPTDFTTNPNNTESPAGKTYGYYGIHRYENMSLVNEYFILDTLFHEGLIGPDSLSYPETYYVARFTFEEDGDFIYDLYDIIDGQINTMFGLKISGEWSLTPDSLFNTRDLEERWNSDPTPNMILMDLEPVFPLRSLYLIKGQFLFRYYINEEDGMIFIQSFKEVQ